jgi:hypothetical protein
VSHRDLSLNTNVLMIKNSQVAMLLLLVSDLSVGFYFI